MEKILCDLRQAHCHDVRIWRTMDTRVTWRTNARRYARQYGESLAVLANGHVLRYWRDTDGTIRQQTITRDIQYVW